MGRIFKQKRFPIVLIDEVALANALDILITMFHGVRAMALIGEDTQLLTIVNKAAKEMGFDISTFERMCKEVETSRRITQAVPYVLSSTFSSGSTLLSIT